MRILSCQQMKEVEIKAQNYGLDFYRLMENAGSAAAKCIRELCEVGDKRVVILCGRGNNGGDGFVVARKLAQNGAHVTVALVDGSPKTPEANEMLTFIRGEEVRLLNMDFDQTLIASAIAQAHIIIDAVFGIGFRGELGPSIMRLFSLTALNEEAMKFALDIPSGADGNTGQVVTSCFEADHTISFEVLKSGHMLFPCAEYCGQLHVVSIGIPEDAFAGIECKSFVTDRNFIKNTLKPRRRDSHKGDYGKLLCITSSVGMTGASVLAARAAYRSGAGLVTVATAKDAAQAISCQLTEPIILPLPQTPNGAISKEAMPILKARLEHYNTLLMGCGLSYCEDTVQVVSGLLSNIKIPVVIDADGINVVSENINILKEISVPVVLTPHMGEMSRLCKMSVDRIKSNPMEIARSFAAEYGVTLVLKGSKTIIATPQGIVYINQTGNPGMAKGGSGDALAGMISGLIAQGIDPQRAAICGVYLHGLAGDYCAAQYSEYSFLPSDLIEQLPNVFRNILSQQ